MAKRLDVADKKSLSLQGYMNRCSAARCFVTATVDRIVNELLSNTPNGNMEKIDLYLNLIFQQLNEVNKWNEMVADSFPVHQFQPDRAWMNFVLQTLDKIITAASGKKEESIILSKLKHRLFLQSQGSTCECTVIEIPKKDTLKTDSNQRLLQLPVVKMLATEGSPCECHKEAEPSTMQNQRVLKHLVLEMPKFHGNILKWVEFWETFETEVHNDVTMTEAHKFSYLKALLTGEEFDFIKNMRTNDANYERAVSLLKSRYGNVDKLISSHKSALLDVKPVGEYCNNLREFFVTMESNVCALESLGVEIDYQSFVAPLLNKLPSVLKQRIYQNEKIKDGDSITMDALRNALSLELQQREG